MAALAAGRSAAIQVAALVCLCLAISACGTLQRGGEGGGYYQDDGPPRRGEGPDPHAVADAVPRVEPLSAGGNRPYRAFGREYRPLASAAGYRERGEASWYGRKYHGRRTSNGEVYDMFAMTAAHPVLPLPSYVRVTSLDNGRSVIVRVNDRGPFLGGRIIDLSWMAAEKLGITAHGTGRVEVAAIDPRRWHDERGAPVRVARSEPPERIEPVAVIGPAASATDGAARLVQRIVPAAAAEVPAHTAQAASGLHAYRYVQAGSFAMRSNAETLRDRLIGAGLAQVSLSTVDSGARTLFRVRVGPLADEGLIDRHRQAVERVTGARAIVVGESQCSEGVC